MGHAEEAHDPSMEEILASIRKIIAEDTGGPAPARPSHLSVVPTPVTEESDPAPAEMADAEAVPEPEAVLSAPEAEPTEEEETEAEIEAAQPEAEAEPPKAEEEDPVVEAWAQEFDEFDAPVEEDEDDPVAEDEPEPAPTESAKASPDLAAIAAAMSADKEAGGYRDENGRLLSPQADRAVHSAFSQLAGTILSDQARTLEDLVKDMMRPMLKHWLDDNLPVLVERLVREEIERVSRGRR